MKQLRFLAIGIVAGAAVLAVSLMSTDGEVAVAGETLSVAAGVKTSGKVKQFDALAREIDCQTKGKGKESGNLEVEYDQNGNSLIYTISITDAKPNTQYMVDIVECASKGERTARGYGGQFTSDGSGNGTVQGTWPIQTDAKWLKASVLAICTAPGEDVPTVPCDQIGFATDAIKPPGR